MLAEILRFKFAITVSGSHGKTTTTSIIASIFESSKLDPTMLRLTITWATFSGHRAEKRRLRVDT